MRPKLWQEISAGLLISLAGLTAFYIYSAVAAQGIPSYTLVAQVEGVRVYHVSGVGFSNHCYLAVSDLKGMAGGQQSSISCTP